MARGKAKAARAVAVRKGQARKQPEPYLRQASPDFDPSKELKLQVVENPLPHGTLGDIGIATHVKGPARFPLTVLVQPFDHNGLAGIDATSIRMFRLDGRARSLQPVWNSGINLGLGHIWAKIERAGVYVPVGLPRDGLLAASLGQLARERRVVGAESPKTMRAVTKEVMDLWLETPPEELDELRTALVLAEVQAGIPPGTERQLRRGKGAGLAPFPLPGDGTMEAFRKRLAGLRIAPGGLPEEALFFPPDFPDGPEPPWPIPPLPPSFPPSFPFPDRPWWRYWSWWRYWFWGCFRWRLCFLFPRDWWMYHHDERHSGVASGCSGIRSTTVGCLALRSTVTLDGPIISIPSIVAGKIYVGTGSNPSGGGTLYKIDLATGTVEGTYGVTTPVGQGSRQGYPGIASSPAVVGGRAYFSALNGKVYCLDANTLAPLWITDLRHPDAAHNQPVDHGSARSNGWSSPLVVNGRVYVGFGEGESNAFGFVYCLDANTGNVVWLFCTNLFAGAIDNSPNVIPASVAGLIPLPAPFTTMPDPAQRGASPWSSCAYDSALSRIYIGTGNAVPDDPLPDPKYSSGLLSLDATAGAYRGFFQPDPADSYRPQWDYDVDVPAPPMIYSAGGVRRVAFGSKNGSFFVLKTDMMPPSVLAKRQLLPYDSAGNPFPNVDPPDSTTLGGQVIRENRYGVFGCSAVHYGLGRLFIGVGGYGAAIDSNTTPFMRAVDWNTLADAWTTAGTNPPKYTVPVPPMYTTPGETALSSPAIVNDVAFVSTSKPGFYAFDAATGLSLWTAAGLGTAWYGFGPAIYGNYVVNGLSNGNLFIYSL